MVLKGAMCSFGEQTRMRRERSVFPDYTTMFHDAIAKLQK